MALVSTVLLWNPQKAPFVGRVDYSVVPSLSRTYQRRYVRNRQRTVEDLARLLRRGDTRHGFLDRPRSSIWQSMLARLCPVSIGLAFLGRVRQIQVRREKAGVGRCDGCWHVARLSISHDADRSASPGNTIHRFAISNPRAPSVIYYTWRVNGGSRGDSLSPIIKRVGSCEKCDEIWFHDVAHLNMWKVKECQLRCDWECEAGSMWYSIPIYLDRYTSEPGPSRGNMK